MRSLASPTLQPQTPLQLPPILRAPPLPHRSPPTVKSPKPSSTSTEDKQIGHSGDKPAEPVDQAGQSGDKPVPPVDQDESGKTRTEESAKSAVNKPAEPDNPVSTPVVAEATDTEAMAKTSEVDMESSEQVSEETQGTEKKEEGDEGDKDEAGNDCQPVGEGK